MKTEAVQPRAAERRSVLKLSGLRGSVQYDRVSAVPSLSGGARADA